MANSIRVDDDFSQYETAFDKLAETTVYHHPNWSSCLKEYGLQYHQLVAVARGQPVGVLPLVRQSSRLFGRRLVGMPWVDAGGVVGTADATLALAEHAIQAHLGLGRGGELLIKLPLEAHVFSGDSWRPAADDKVLLRRRLDLKPDVLWKELSAKVRNQVRKADKSGLVTERGGTELVDDFFEVYARNMRDLGSPSHSKKFFRLLVEGLGDLAAVYCTRLEGKPVGAGIVLNNGASLDIPWASSLRDYNRLCVNHGMYWKILSDACEAGYEWFHFGRSTIGSGQHKFKKQWGAEEVPLNWWVYRPEGSKEPTVSLKPDEGFGLAQEVWRRLPVWLTKRLGPLVIRHVM